MRLKIDHVNWNQTEKQKQISLLPFLFLFIYFLLISASLLQAAENQSNSQKIENILRQDILRFVGPISDSLNFTIPDDAYLVRLNPKRLAKGELGKLPPAYNMLIRNVDPVEKALFQDAQDGKWDNFNLFRAAMVAEGERDPAKIKSYEIKLDAILQKIKNKNQNNNSASAENLTRELFESLHKEIMTRQYDINCTNLSRVFETGKFNCVSATVLFNVLGEKAGLNVHALEMPGHALSRVRFAGKEMDLETTCPDWFKLENKDALAAATTQRVAQSEAAAPNPVAGNNMGNKNMQDTESASVKLAELSKRSREITPVQLIATIYYNHGVDLLNEKRYAEAAMVNIKALYLDPESETAWGNLMVAINNWALELSSGSATNGIKRYDLAAILFDQGCYMDTGYEKFKTNQLHVYYHWILDLAIKGRIDAAKEVFTYADKRLPNNPTLARLMDTIKQQTNK
jgi:tetratricopeptide (TPR) repeat protein